MDQECETKDIFDSSRDLFEEDVMDYVETASPLPSKEMPSSSFGSRATLTKSHLLEGTSVDLPSCTNIDTNEKRNRSVKPEGEKVVFVDEEISDDDLVNSVCLLEDTIDSSPQKDIVCRPSEGSLNLSLSQSNHKGTQDTNDLHVQKSRSFDSQTSWGIEKANNTESQAPTCHRVKSSTSQSLEGHEAAAWYSNSTVLSSSSSRKTFEPHENASSSLLCEDESDFRCPFCNQDFESAVKLCDHVNTVHDDGKKSLTCPLCSFKCYYQEEMQEHVSLHEFEGTYYGASSGVTPTKSAQIPDETLACPMCDLLLPDPDLLTSHVETHFSPQHQPGKSDSREKQSKKSWDQENSCPAKAEKQSSSWEGSGSYKQQHERGLERAFERGEISTAEFHERRAQASRMTVKDIDDGLTRTPGLVEKIADTFRRQARKGQSVHLCNATDHFSGSFGDKGWGCGYRNFQMMLSCLLRHRDFAHRLAPLTLETVPSIPRVQEMIEEAWRKGFDPQGSQQLGGRLCRTRKWIGATEIVAVLSSLRIKCQLVDFHVPSSPDGSHPRLLQWALDYFMSTQDFKAPLYLQHQGHSRTIVGVESDKGATKLHLFDPGNPNMPELARAPLGWREMKTFRRPQQAFKSHQYQIVAVVGLLEDRDYQDSKTLKSYRIS